MLIFTIGVGLSNKIVFPAKLVKPVSLFQSVIIVEVVCSKPTTFLSYKHNHLSGTFFWFTSSDTCGRRDGELGFTETGVSERYITAD